MPFSDKLVCFAIVLSCSVSALSQCANSTDAQASISLKLHQVHDTVAQGDPVLVGAVLTNLSKHEISIWRAPGFEYNVDVRDEKKNLAPDTELGRYRNGHADVSKMRPEEINPKYLNGAGACMTLKPGESLSDEIDVSRYYKLSLGKYAIQLSHVDPATSKTTTSNTVTITITETTSQ